MAFSVRPSWRIEKALWREGWRRVAGVDEVGRGPLAGPVVAAAVILPYSRARWSAGLRDSKLLTPAARERLAEEIHARCECGLGAVSPHVIDQLGIAAANRLAMRRAVLALSDAPDALVVDGRERVPCDVGRQRAETGADARCKSVAAASIIAKVARDEVMRQLDRHFPGYGLRRNKGYASAEHLAALRRLGYSNAHRLSFAPVRAAMRDNRSAVQR